MSDNEKKYWECVLEIEAVLKKHDMAGAITVISKERAAFKYHFPTWSCIILSETELRFRSKREDYPSREAQHQAAELSTHIILQMRDIAAQTFTMCEAIEKGLREKFEIEHTPFKNFDPESSL
jgi:hypothetical protein